MMTDCYPIPEFLRTPKPFVRAPTERPVLFSAPMVRAILAGTKTQTRRIVKPKWSIYPASDPRMMKWSPECPYGQPGDRLWVREKWSADPPIDGSWASTEWNGCGRKVREIPERFHHPRFCNYAADWLHEPIRWTPSIHMPRWASRILLKIESVRVERLQEISEADALAEGITEGTGDFAGCFSSGTPAMSGTTAKECYARLWDEINGKGAWKRNDFVWVISFRRVKP